MVGPTGWTMPNGFFKTQRRPERRFLFLEVANSSGSTKSIFLNQTKAGASQGAKALESLKPFLENLGDTKLILSACPVHRNHSTRLKWLPKSIPFISMLPKTKKKTRRCSVGTGNGTRTGSSFCQRTHGIFGRKIKAPARLGVEEVRKLASYLGKEKGEITERIDHQNGS